MSDHERRRMYLVDMGNILCAAIRNEVLVLVCLNQKLRE